MKNNQHLSARFIFSLPSLLPKKADMAFDKTVPVSKPLHKAVRRLQHYFKTKNEP
jgi:hypothetical protein